jgi:Cd(II)/Pb(II)-responsive transcriptional regulator
MRIGEISQATGVDIETIRYYEKEGLLPNPPRQANGYRDYGPQQLERLAFIRHCRALDIPLADIAQLLGFLRGAPTDCNDINHLVDDHLARIQARLESMRALEKQLITLRARCNRGNKTTECGILHELVAAAHGEVCACHNEL